MNPNDPTAKPKPSFKKRLGILASVLWVILALVISLNVNTYRYGSLYAPMTGVHIIGFFTDFIVFGIIPIILAFGLSWVAAAHRHKN